MPLLYLFLFIKMYVFSYQLHYTSLLQKIQKTEILKKKIKIFHSSTTRDSFSNFFYTYLFFKIRIILYLGQCECFLCHQIFFYIIDKPSIIPPHSVELEEVTLGALESYLIAPPHSTASVCPSHITHTLLMGSIRFSLPVI